MYQETTHLEDSAVPDILPVLNAEIFLSILNKVFCVHNKPLIFFPKGSQKENWGVIVSGYDSSNQEAEVQEPSVG